MTNSVKACKKQILAAERDLDKTTLHIEKLKQQLDQLTDKAADLRFDLRNLNKELNVARSIEDPTGFVVEIQGTQAGICRNHLSTCLCFENIQYALVQKIPKDWNNVKMYFVPNSAVTESKRYSSRRVLATYNSSTSSWNIKKKYAHLFE